jgi:hypothetical protein
MAAAICETYLTDTEILDGMIKTISTHPKMHGITLFRLLNLLDPMPSDDSSAGRRCGIRLGCKISVVGVAMMIAASGCSGPSTVRPNPADSRLALSSVTTAIGSQGDACGSGGGFVAVLVEPRLLAGIRQGLDQFCADLRKDGYTVIPRALDFPTPPQLRSYLVEANQNSKGRLVGALLIGDFPHPYQWVVAKSSNPRIPDTREELISCQYYTDLDGRFEASPGYKSRGNHAFSYDVHEGNVDWEIWLGILPIYKGDVATTIEAINRYFAKNHAYRSGESPLPRAFMQISEHSKSTSAEQDKANLENKKTGPYTWGPFSNAKNSRFYFSSTTPALSLDQGYADLSAGVADFAVLNAHGSWRASGKLTIASVETNPVRTIFLWSDGCAVGDLDHRDNFLTSVLYSTTSSVLLARGTTNNSGGMGNNEKGFFGANIATALTRKMSFGDAILAHVNVPLLSPWSESREFHYGTFVMLGDPTLRIR